MRNASDGHAKESINLSWSWLIKSYSLLARIFWTIPYSFIDSLDHILFNILINLAFSYIWIACLNSVGLIFGWIVCALSNSRCLSVLCRVIDSSRIWANRHVDLIKDANGFSYQSISSSWISQDITKPDDAPPYAMSCTRPILCFAFISTRSSQRDRNSQHYDRNAVWRKLVFLETVSRRVQIK